MSPAVELHPQKLIAAARTILTIAATLIILFAPVPMFATLPSETGLHPVNYALIIDPDATDRVRINLPATREYEEDMSISRDTRSPSVFVFQDNVFDPNSSTGWHYHPGIVLATVVEGSVDWYDANCTKHVRKSGDFFMESDRMIHNVRNSSAAPARLIMTFIIAKGLTFKIGVPAPACAVPLGLK
jgi:quercetin dioxygenase-like cupin family protein